MAWQRTVRPEGASAVTLTLTGAADGDLAVDGDPDELRARRAAVVEGEWTWLRQVHGADVVVVDRPGARAGEHADAAVTAVPGAVLAVHTADCAGVLLVGSTGSYPVVGAAHAGWRGLLAGVLQETVAAMERLGARRVEWVLGPCIGPESYEFGPDDLDLLADRYGPGVRATTSDGRPALDLRQGVRTALREAGAAPMADVPDPACTATSPGWFSWRAQRTTGRQAALVVIDTSDVAAP